MSNKSPIFPISDPQHYSDYGFDPQINYFQVLEEAMKHKKESTSTRSIDSIHFKLQKPISKDESKKSKKKRWWRSALFFFKWRRSHRNHHHQHHHHHREDNNNDVHKARAQAFRASVSGPVYLTESRSGSSTPYRTTSRPSSGPLAGTLMSPMEVPYLSLRELTMEQQQLQGQQRMMSTSAMPIYLVT